MSEHDELGARLAGALHDEADRLRPDPALQTILARTQQRRRSAPAGSRRWWPVLAGAVSAAALVVVALVVFGLPHGSRPPETASPTSRSVTTVYFINPGGRLVPAPVTIRDTGNPVPDAVRALLTAKPVDPDYVNPWLCAGMQYDASTATTRTTVVTVNFQRPSRFVPGVGCGIDQPLVLQQLAFTVASAAPGATAVRLRGLDLYPHLPRTPVSLQPEDLAPIILESPTQGQRVSSPVRVTGTSDTFEANVAWRVLQDGKVIRSAATMGGSYGQPKAFGFRVRLAPGSYTVEVYEQSPRNGKVINLDSKDFTVE